MSNISKALLVLIILYWVFMIWLASPIEKTDWVFILISTFLLVGFFIASIVGEYLPGRIVFAVLAGSLLLTFTVCFKGTYDLMMVGFPSFLATFSGLIYIIYRERSRRSRRYR